MALPDPLETPLRTSGCGVPWAAPAGLLLLASALWAFFAPGLVAKGTSAAPVKPKTATSSPANASPPPAPASHGHDIHLKRLTILLPILTSQGVQYSDAPPPSLPPRGQMEALFNAYDGKIRRALLAQWQAPEVSGAVVLDVVHATFTFTRDGKVQRAKLTAPSNSPSLNESVEQLLHQYAKAPSALPVTLMDETYELDAEFRVY